MKSSVLQNNTCWSLSILYYLLSNELNNNVFICRVVGHVGVGVSSAFLSGDVAGVSQGRLH